MKILIGIIVAIVLVGGLFWFLSSDNASSDTSEEQNNADPLSENGRVLESDEDVFEEIDDAMGGFE